MGSIGKKTASLIVIAILVAIYFIVPIPEYMGKDELLSAVSHHFFHANILHLAVNCYATYMLFNARRFTLGYIIGSLSYFVAPIPTIGFSNLLYAAMGLATPPLYSHWWKKPSTIIFICVTCGYLFIPKVSAITHIASFIAGACITAVVRGLKQSKEDYGKARRKG